MEAPTNADKTVVRMTPTRLRTRSALLPSVCIFESPKKLSCAETAPGHDHAAVMHYAYAPELIYLSYRASTSVDVRFTR